MVNKENYYQEYISAKAVVHNGDFPAYALSKHKANPS